MMCIHYVGVVVGSRLVDARASTQQHRRGRRVPLMRSEQQWRVPDLVHLVRRRAA